MEKTRRISSFTLERFRLGEVRPEERAAVEADLRSDKELFARHERLEASDRELRFMYPWEQISSAVLSVAGAPAEEATALSGVVTAEGGANASGTDGGGKVIRFPRKKIIRVLCAAALLLCALFPALHFFREQAARGASGEVSLGPKAGGTDAVGLQAVGNLAVGTDRVKGTELKTELSVYIKDAAVLPPVVLPPASAALSPFTSSLREPETAVSTIQADGGTKLPDQTLLKAGSTVQLAYATPPGAVYYGVIFSIDGRSALTVHYPYRMGEAPVLAAGKRTFLNEAYTLDDAPDFEIFFMVVSPEPLDTENVLSVAGDLARDPKTALEKSAAAFSGCQVAAVTIRK